jgi:UDP:flavonoid glycosyltransferase YjiC (YdhE family)
MMEIILYRDAQEIVAELDVDPDTGEIRAEYPLEVLVRRNPIGCAGYVLHTQSQMKMLKAHIDDMQARYKAAENRAERVKQSLKEVMQMTGTLTIESTDATFRVKLHKERDSSVEIFDANQIPSDYMRIIPETSAPDKALIKRAINDGFDVPGAKIVKTDRIEIK